MKIVQNLKNENYGFETIKNNAGMSWEMVKIKDITVNLDNKRKPLNESERNKIAHKHLYPYIGANNIMGYVDEFLFNEEIICVAEDGGSWGENQKCCVYISEKCWVNNHAHVLGGIGKADLKYLMYYLNAQDLNKFITGSTRGKLTKSALDSIEIPLPPLPIQKRIAEILDAADALKRKDQELLKKYDELAQAIFIDMFGDPVKNEKGWEVKSIRSIATKISDGPFGSNLKTEHYANDGIRVIRLKNIGVNSFKDDDSAFVSSQHYENVIKKYTCLPGDILIATLGEPNLRACLFPYFLEKAVNKADCVMLRINSEICNQNYISYFLNIPSFVESVSNKLHGQTRTRISMGQVADLNILIPPKPLQDKFSNIIALLNSQNQIVESQSHSSGLLFNTLIQKAFKGELVQ